MTRSRAWMAALVVVVIGFAVVVAAAGGPSLTPGPTGSTAGPTASPRPAATDLVAGGPTDPALPTILRADLPPEARATLDLIAAGGPFPYDADGSVYQNRERNLPLRPAGMYREYTVETPGSADRGARRIVVAGSGESYWTADHYASFARIVP